MNPSQTIQSTMWAAILVQTIGAMDPPGRGPRKMPAPGQYAAIFAAWTVLGFLANTAYARAARAMAVVFFLTTLVLGPGGQRLIGLMGSIATDYGTPAGTPAGSASPAAPTAPVATRYVRPGRSTLAAPTAPTAPLAPSPSATVST